MRRGINKILLSLFLFLIVFLIPAFVVTILAYQMSNIKFSISVDDPRNYKLPPNMKNLLPIIIEKMEKHKLDKRFLPYIIAQITQESYGQEPDVFQASESKYDGAMGMIKTVDESIDHGILRWTQIIQSIFEKELEFSIPLILQTYNYGSGYLNYVKEHGGGYSFENATEFSNLMLQNPDWQYSVYGDKKYVEHCLRYLNAAINFLNDEDYLNTEEISSITSSNKESFEKEARKYLGVKYVLGADSENGMDCSAYTRRVFKSVNIFLPRTAQAQYNYLISKGGTIKKSLSQLKYGDILFFHSTYQVDRYVTHVGIYLGNDKMIHQGGSKCHILNLSKSGLYKNHWIGGGTLIAFD